MEDGTRSKEHEGWNKEHGARSMEQGAWRMEHGGWSKEDGAWRVQHGACSVEHRACSSPSQLLGQSACSLPSRPRLNFLGKQLGFEGLKVKSC